MRNETDARKVMAAAIAEAAAHVNQPYQRVDDDDWIVRRCGLFMNHPIFLLWWAWNLALKGINGFVEAYDNLTFTVSVFRYSGRIEHRLAHVDFFVF